MFLKDDSLYAIESLVFLAAFPSDSWTKVEISRVVGRDPGCLRKLRKALHGYSPAQIREVLCSPCESTAHVKGHRVIANVLGILVDHAFLSSSGEGYRITQKGLEATLLETCELFQDFRIAHCTGDKPPLRCPRKKVCYSIQTYESLESRVRELFASVTIGSILVVPPTRPVSVSSSQQSIKRQGN